MKMPIINVKKPSVENKTVSKKLFQPAKMKIRPAFTETEQPIDRKESKK